jgi:alpha-1,2-mannosyltransferase
MMRLLQAIRTGDWITLDRIRVYSAIMLAIGVIMIGGLVVTSDGLVDYKRRPLGTDFSNVYAAGKWVLAGRPEAPFDNELQHQMEQRIFGADTPFYGWPYPPIFLGLAALLALMPYLLALAVWQTATLLSYLATVRAILPRTEVWLPALAFPAVFINVTHGNNGLLTATLLGSGLLFLDRRPLLSGILLGFLAYKPHFGLMIPLVLAASGRWRVFAAAAATVVALVVVTWIGFGGASWVAFRDSFEFTRTVILEQGDTGFFKMQSPFAAVRLWHGSVPLAYAVQGAAVLMVGFFLVRLWRSEAAFALKAAALLLGALISTPYLLDYDLMVMAPAIAFLVSHGLERGFLSYEKTALAFCWVAPLLTRSLAEQIGLPLGLIALVMLFVLTLRRASAEFYGSRSLSALRVVK